MANSKSIRSYHDEMGNLFILIYLLFPCRLHYIHWQKWPRRRDCAGREGNISMKIDCWWWYKIRNKKDEMKLEHHRRNGEILTAHWVSCVTTGAPANTRLIVWHDTPETTETLGLIPHPLCMAARSSDSCHQAPGRESVMWCLVLHPPRASIYHMSKKNRWMKIKSELFLSFFLFIHTQTAHPVTCTCHLYSISHLRICMCVYSRYRTTE